MMTINLTRKDAYLTGLAISSIPLMLFAACLLGVQFLLDLQPDAAPISQNTNITAADQQVTGNVKAETRIKLDLLSGRAPQAAELSHLAKAFEASELADAVEVAELVEMVEITDNSEEVLSSTTSISTNKGEAIILDEFTVQLAAFSVQKNAQTLVGELLDSGMQPQLLIKSGSKTPYIIAVGLYHSQREARTAAQQHNKINHSESFGVSMAGMSFNDEIAKL